MKTRRETHTHNELQSLCASVRTRVYEGDYTSPVKEICTAMELYPHAPEPHNLMGIILEKKGDHISAMKHFRASWALDPSYLPARYNLHTYGTFFSFGKCAFDESDIPDDPAHNSEAASSKRGGHFIGKPRF